MKYRNRYTGTVVEPSAEVAALNYAADPTWEEIIEEQKAPDPPAGQENTDPPTSNDADPPDAQKNPDPPINNDDDPPDGQNTPDTPEGQPPTNGKEEPECSQPEQTATSQSNTPTATSPSTTSPKASSKNAGQTSTQKKKK